MRTTASGKHAHTPTLRTFKLYQRLRRFTGPALAFRLSFAWRAAA
jgi:hypothetical protein